MSTTFKKAAAFNVLRLDAASLIAKLVPEVSGAKWNKIFVTGKFHRDDFPGGVAKFDRSFFETMLANWLRAGSKPLPVDYFHRGESWVSGSTAEKVASGWIEDIRLDFTGEPEALISWTDDARSLILADKLRYLSPTFAFDAIDRTTGKPQGPTLFGAGLLNDPFLTELPRVAASAVPHPKALGLKQEHAMDKKEICAALGLPEETPDSEVMAALVKHRQEVAVVVDEKKSLEAAVEKATLSATSRADGLHTEKVALAAEVSTLSAEVTKLRAEKFDLSVKSLTDTLRSEGRILPINAGAVVEMARAIGIEKATTYFKAQPAIVSLTELGHNAGGGEKVDLPKAEALTKFTALVDAEVSKGMPATQAFRAVSKAHPELAKATR